MTATPNALNALLRGEMSAVETYRQALAKLGDTKGAPQLRRIQDEHRDAVNVLRQHVIDHGGKPESTSGAWGAFASLVEGTAKLFGPDAALKALKEGEQQGVRDYEAALAAGELPAECRKLIHSKLHPQTLKHIPVLDGLMSGLVERVDVQDARKRVQAGNSMLVCAYDDDEKFRKNNLEGAISYATFEARKDEIPRSRELIFYCA
jgi:uncharacterized protein (TIGR02284 family)